MPIGATCSAVLSAACHGPGDESIALIPLRWGVIELDFEPQTDHRSVEMIIDQPEKDIANQQSKDVIEHANKSMVEPALPHISEQQLHEEIITSPTQIVFEAPNDDVITQGLSDHSEDNSQPPPHQEVTEQHLHALVVTQLDENIVNSTKEEDITQRLFDGSEFDTDSLQKQIRRSIDIDGRCCFTTSPSVRLPRVGERYI
jgi:hypothetical protein